MEIGHVDASRNYAQYGSQAVSGSTRHQTKCAGEGTFTTIYPGGTGPCAPIHMKGPNNRSIKATQIAFPNRSNACRAGSVRVWRGLNSCQPRQTHFADSFSSEIITPSGAGPRLHRERANWCHGVSRRKFDRDRMGIGIRD